MGKPRHKIYLVQDYIAECNRAGSLNDFLNGVKFYKLSWNTVTRLLCYQLLIGAHSTRAAQQELPSKALSEADLLFIQIVSEMLFVFEQVPELGCCVDLWKC